MPKFKIVGNKKVAGKNPGEVVNLENLEQIISLTKAGHIEKIDKKKQSKKVIDQVKKENK